MKKSFTSLFTLFSVIIFGSSAFAQTNVFDDVIATSPNHTHLTTALEETGLDEVLRNSGAEYTVFAPDDDAIENLADQLGVGLGVLLNQPTLQDVLLYHVLDSQVLSSAINNGDIVTPLNAANTLKLTATSEGNVFVNQAQVNAADLTTDNGVVHSLDAVLLADETVADVAIDNGFTSLIAAVVTAELLPALTDPFADFTVFAPSDAAFGDLAAALGTDIDGLLADPELANILLYHVLDGAVMSSMINNGDIVTPLNDANTLKLTATSGGDIFINQAVVELADVGADNGIVHAIDAVLLSSETVADVAIDNGFTSLTAAVVTAELLPALTDPFADFTVFAPTDEAFDALAEALETDLDGILALPNLADILLYHVVGEEVLSTELVEGELTMLNGENTLIDLSDGIQINNATVDGPDNGADNGVVHIIDAVLDVNFLTCNSETFPVPENLQVTQLPGASFILFTWDPVPGSVACKLKGGIVGEEMQMSVVALSGEDGAEPFQRAVSRDEFEIGEEYEVRIRCACSLDPAIAGEFSEAVIFVPEGIDGISEQQGNTATKGSISMSVFPNPSSLGFINLKVSNAEGIATDGIVEIRDITGRSVTTRRVALEANQLLQIETNSMPSGMYTVSYTSGYERITERFVVK
jgi:uncharacterized surface protein with fasciclin (FAS1) repeats